MTRFMALMLFFSVTALLAPAGARADGVGGCNFGLRDYSDRGSVVIFNRNGSITLQMVLDDDVSVFPKVTSSTATGDQVRDEAKKNAQFSKAMADSHIFPSDVQRLTVYLADPGAGSSSPSTSYYGFYGDQNLFLGGFGTIGKDWYVCDWQ